MINEQFRFTGSILDGFLAQGCYRMRQDVFTTSFIWHNGDVYPVFWLRYPLTGFSFAKKAIQLTRQNSFLETTVKPFSLTRELEDLYQRYFEHTQFDAPHSLQDFLFSETDTAALLQNRFDSWIMEVRHNGILVAAGVFDNGDTAIAGIMNFYDPAYHKYSLGKYLMLLKITHAINLQKLFYYPGYISLGYQKFDYKLFPNPRLAEIFNPVKKQWLPYSPQLLSELTGDMPEL